MRDPRSRAEHYRKLAVKYHELANHAEPAYLGDFYRNIAGRYASMAEDGTERSNKEVRFVPRSGSPTEVSGSGCAIGEPEFDLLAVWAAGRPASRS
jgi:hypothetical protein